MENLWVHWTRDRIIVRIRHTRKQSERTSMRQPSLHFTLSQLNSFYTFTLLFSQDKY
jgi:hypothetical protein